MITTLEKAPLNKAFRELRKQGINAHQNFWCCQNCGLHALPESAERTGYVFYHAQDAQHLKDDGECYLAWGIGGDSIKKTEKEVIAFGRLVVSILKGAGVKTEWDGTQGQRIKVILTENEE